MANIIYMHLLHRFLVHLYGLVCFSSQQVNLPEHHEGFVVLVYLESYLKMFLSLRETEDQNDQIPVEQLQFVLL